MVYFLAGQERSVKDQKLSHLRSKLFPSPDALSLDHEILHAPGLDPDDLKESLSTFPVLSKKRLVVIRQADKLTPAQKKMIADALSGAGSNFDLVLDYDKGSPPEDLVRLLGREAQVLHRESQSDRDVFKIGEAIAAARPEEALKEIAHHLDDGKHPLELIGSILWSWSNKRGRLAGEKYAKGLRAIQEADYHIKRSRLRPDHALEVLVVKLCGLRAL